MVVVGCELAAGHQRDAAAALLGGDGGRDEVVGFVAGAACVSEAKGFDDLRQQVELFE
jgi:hypothetical protein